MTTFDSAITRAETDLAHVQSALDTAQQVLEVADQAHSVGRRVVRMIRVVAIVFAIGGVLVAVFVLFDRLWRGFHREQDHETTDVTGSSPSPRAVSEVSPRAVREVSPPSGPKDGAEPDPHPTGNV